MKILQIDKFNYLKGGAQRYYLELSTLLRQHGHTVSVFSQQHEGNVDTRYQQYFPKERYRFFESREVDQKLERLIVQEQPDIAHVHLLYHHLTPSILKVLRRHRIPVVMTVHDYKLICPNYLLFTEGSPCQRCQGHKYYNAVLHKCIKNSTAKSAIVAAEMYWHKLFRSYEGYIDQFITPSEFAKTKLVEFGQNASKITVIPHFMNLQDKTPNYQPGEYLLYVGRLSAEKGVDKLIEVFYNNSVSERLVIAGTGPLQASLQAQVQTHRIEDKVEFLGHIEGNTLASVIQRCKYLVVPSLVWETFGLVALEAFAYGKPVLAHNVGGLTEVVEHGTTGWLYHTSTDLTDRIIHLQSAQATIIQQGKYARQVVETRYTPQQHYEHIMSVYDGVLSGSVTTTRSSCK